MIELIHALLKNSGAEEMTLSIRPSGENVTVIAHTTMGAVPANATADVMAVRANLTTPLVATGFVGEVDAELGNQIMTFTESFVSAAKSSNIEEVKANHAKASSGTTAAKTSDNKVESTSSVSSSEPDQATASVVEPEDLFEESL